MNCHEAEHHIYTERDGALNADRRAALAEHVTGCAACRRIQRNLGAALQEWNTATLEVRPPDPDEEWIELRREIRRGAKTPRRFSIGWIAIPVAGTATITLGLYFSPGNTRTSPAPTRDDPVAAAATNVVSASPTDNSTVVYVDDKSGWTFVLGGDATGQQHI